ncbi:MAG: TIGR01777 family oxidoreductase [Chlamydiales bacterium]
MHTRKAQFCKTAQLSRPAQEVFNWHERVGAIERMLSSLKELRLLAHEGRRLTLQIRIGLSWEKWVLELHTSPETLSGKFVQIEGPFRDWSYTFALTAQDARRCALVEQVEFSLPFPLSTARFYKKVERYFRWRHKTLEDDLISYAKNPLPPLKILVSGSTGLIGSALVPFLRAAGHHVVPLARSKKGVDPSSLTWHPESGELEINSLEGFDLVIHLAGENIAKRRWTKDQKQRLFLSRTRDTWFLTQALLRLNSPPKTVICASACGIYGDRGDELLTEESSPGQGFLADLCVKWEEAASTLEKRNIRLIQSRFGPGLSSNGGFLEKMLPFFRLGLGGKLGSGKQLIPWVALDDMVGALYHLIAHQEIKGAVNICSPEPVTQEVFAKTLAQLLHRPAFFHIPSFLVRLAFGELADALLLSSQNARPKKLLESKYEFRYQKLKDALETIII